ncbi:AAA family ATPase [Streptodolium elevatio]
MTAEQAKDLPGGRSVSASADPDTAAWRIFRGDGVRRTPDMPEPPPWRRFDRGPSGAEPESSPGSQRSLARHYVIGQAESDVVNTALHLRRPLLVTGHPGTGKSSLAAALAHELGLGSVLHWPISSRSTVRDALYSYDAIGRLQETNLTGAVDEHGKPRTTPPIGNFLRLGPLGTALAPTGRPRVLLVDELDKGDIDLPNDLLTVFEEGFFEIPELSRLPETQPKVEVLTADPHRCTTVHRGVVRCTEFPVVVITSNGERDFPPAFRRRCIPLHFADPDEERLRAIISGHLGDAALHGADELISEFLAQRAVGGLATDQLLNAVFLRLGGVNLAPGGLLETVLHQLSPDG